MVVYWKEEDNLVKNFKSLNIEYQFYKKQSFFSSLFGSKDELDIYFHSSPLDKDSLEILKKAKITIVNNDILKDKIIQKYKIDENRLKVIYPVVENKKIKKDEIKKDFYEKYDLNLEDKIIYFSAKNYIKNGFEKFCDIVSKLNSTNFKTFATYFNEDSLNYGKNIAKEYNLDIIFLDKEIFEYSDIFILPTDIKNFAISTIKAMVNKNAVFISNKNYAIDLVDIFGIIEEGMESQVVFRIDMLLRVEDELKKIQKENYSIAKKLNDEYQIKKLKRLV